MLFSDLLTTAATWLLGACAVWVGLICVAGALEAATAGRLRATSWVGCPAPARRLLLATLGVALAASPAHASSTQGSATPASSRQGSSGQASSPLGGLPSPARPVGGAPRAASGPGGQAHVLVRPGDTLWRLARSRLPAAASAEDIAALVGRLHRRNRQVIGPDADLILPGQQLVVPPPLRHQTRAATRQPEENP